MVKGITMLDNVCSSDEEFTTIVVEKGGKKVITQLQQTHGFEDELQAAAQSALLSIDAMQKTKEQAGSKVLFIWAKRNFILVDQTGWTSNFVYVFFMHQ